LTEVSIHGTAPVALTLDTAIGIKPCDDLIEPTAQAFRRDRDPDPHGN
jgi:hypothetical protein